MGIPVLVLGESGSGKSASLRNFKDGEVGIINVSSKPLPFKSTLKPFNSDDYMKIEQVIKKAKAKSIVIDDAQYLQANEYMRNAKIQGYQKFTDIALNFWTLVQMIIKELPSNVIVYLLGHIETDANGKEKFKTVGKMTDNYSVEGMCTIVLKTLVEDGHYYFTTQTNGFDTVKSPMGMFNEAKIENDLKKVDETIRQYYELT
ncbi:MAG: ATP-binding protein [Faecalibacterium sp.]|nr:ATP-binding protein [Ruminococcus sp.]MCM1391888.1 ATP-binding protein [Ruminococcus sp.]MCM1485536.1 ATP-binding protein [Faecalibacterium sp.]